MEKLVAEKEIFDRLSQLKNNAGTHSPSIFTILKEIPELKIKVDACFLSNPYATELFIQYLKDELIDTGKIYDVLEFYPSQNDIIAELISSKIEVKKENIFVGNGAIEAMQAVIHNYVKGKMVVNIPTFSSYYEFASEQIEVVYNQLEKADNYSLNVDDYIAKINEIRPNAIILINPNNPDGGYIKHKDLLRIIDELSWVENIIIDESFIHFAYEDQNFKLKSIVPDFHKWDNVTVIKSMSKDFGIAGIRCGYAIMKKERVSELLENGYLWNSNGLAEYFFRLYVRDDFLKEYEQVRKKYISETAEFISELNKISGIKVLPSKANFVLVEILNGKTAEQVTIELLVYHGIYVRNCSDKIGLKGEYLRVAARSDEENKIIVSSLKDVVAIH